MYPQFYEGGLSEEDATRPLNEALEPLYAELSESSRATGVFRPFLTAFPKVFCSQVFTLFNMSKIRMLMLKYFVE